MELTVAAILRHMMTEGYPITAQRRAMVSTVMAQNRRFTADDLLAELRQQGLAVGRATVFRTLDLLVHLGYVGRVQDGGHRCYTVCGLEHHHHLVCSGCGQVLHIAHCPVEAYLRQLESTTGYRVATHSLEIAGLCPSCRASAGLDGGPNLG